MEEIVELILTSLALLSLLIDNSQLDASLDDEFLNDQSPEISQYPSHHDVQQEEEGRNQTD